MGWLPRQAVDESGEPGRGDTFADATFRPTGLIPQKVSRVSQMSGMAMQFA
jgi:hypothetical protein